MKKILSIIVLSILLVSCSVATNNLTFSEKKLLNEKLEEINNQMKGANKEELEMIYVQKIRIMQKLGENKEIMQLFNDALKKYPLSVALHNNLAMYYIDIGEYKKAEGELNILKNNVTDIDYKKPYIDLHNLYKDKLHDNVKAIDILNEGIKKYPKATDLMLKLAEFYHLNTKNLKKAKEEYQKILQLEPENTYIKEQLEKIQK